MNVQYAIKDGDIYVLEVNPRASRTVPFVAKVIGMPVAKIAARIMAGESLASFELEPQPLRARRGQGSGVPVRPLPRRRHRAGAGDALDRRGDGHRRSFEIAFAKSQIGGGTRLPRDGTVFVSVKDADKPRIVDAGAAAGRARLQDHRHLGHPALPGRTGGGSRPASTRCWRAGPHIVDAIKNGEVQLVFNTTEGAEALQR